MRLGTIALGLFLPAAAVLTGCGMGTVALPSAESAAVKKTIRGKAYGGQSPVTGASIALYTYGTSGYGSTGTLLASATTGSDGYFTIDPGAIQCPTADTPVYILSLGGVAVNKVNASIAEGASIGPCSSTADAFVTINEISTAMLAYTFSQFFTATSSDGTSTDHFGAPATAAQIVSTASNGTIPTLLNTTTGYPMASTGTMTFESAKLITLGNILATCVNATNPAGAACTALFKNTTPPSGTVPTDTLQAAINIAQNPTLNVAKLYNLQPASASAAFTGGLTAAPNDWTLSASYTSPAFGLGVDSSTVSTIDIDTAGRVWFPSNVDRNAGAGYFDPSTGAFSSLFPGHVSHPQQVAIDTDGYVWENDSQSAYVAGFLATNPTTVRNLQIANATATVVSHSVTVAVDNTIRFGITASDSLPALATVTNKTAYAEIANSELSGEGNFAAASIASDLNGNIAFAGQNTNKAGARNYLYNSAGTPTVQFAYAQDAGQVAYTGTDFAQPRGGYGPRQDGLCLYSAKTCYPLYNKAQRHPSGIAADGNGNLWMADTDTPSVEQIPLTSGSYLTAGGVAFNNVFLHNSTNGNTLIGPAGIAVDGAGNVWVSNYGCYGNNCTPGSFVLSELIGAGAPTATPVASSIVLSSPSGTLVRPKTDSPSK